MGLDDEEDAGLDVPIAQRVARNPVAARSKVVIGLEDDEDQDGEGHSPAEAAGQEPAMRREVDATRDCMSMHLGCAPTPVCWHDFVDVHVVLPYP